MEHRYQTTFRVLLGFWIIGLVLALASCGRESSSPEETTATPASSSQVTATTAPNVTVVPTPTRTEAERAGDALGQDYAEKGKDTVAHFQTVEECIQALFDEQVDGCSAIESATLVTHTVWAELLPNVRFYEVLLFGRRQVDGDLGMPSYGYVLLAWQDDQYYQAEDFDRLLIANDITAVTDENRELAAKAFALMTLPGYLGEQVSFTKWEAGDWPSGWDNYNYYVEAWTKIGGLEIGWWFGFEDNRLRLVTRTNANRGVGDDFIDIPLSLPIPYGQDYRFRGE